jgi:ribose transport system ATP-binding protein
MVPEDRKLQGLILSMNIAENISLPDLPNYRPKWLMRRERERHSATEQVANLHIRPPDIKRKVFQLSGGNQQKVVLGKWLNMSPRVLILDEPTRGIDMGARAEIYERMIGLADSGVTILMVSSDMEEILGIADRVVVLHEGDVTGTLVRDQITREQLGTLMTGGTLQAA